jgi:hypothetical protein
MTLTPADPQNTTGAPQTYYYSQDGLGSVRTLSDSTGTVQNRYDYTAFGFPTATTTSQETIPQRYTYTVSVQPNRLGAGEWAW